MKERYLEVTFRKGKALAAYLYVSRPPGATSVRTEPAGAGVFVDYDANNAPIGIEITQPSNVTLESLNRVLRALNLEPVEASELAPLLAA